MEDMVSTRIKIEDDRDIFYAIVDEELENLDDVSAMDIDVYDDYCEEKDISLKDQKYIHIEVMEVKGFMRYCIIENAFPLESFNSLDRLHWTSHQKRFKEKKKQPSIYSFSRKN